MRYYAIKLTNPNSGNTVAFNYATNKFTPTSAPYTWSSHAAGILDPGALNLELDIVSVSLGQFDQGKSSVRIWGVGLPALGQASNLTNYGIEITAGMQPPYALNSAAKPGLVMGGQIYQSFGNWEGTNQYLEFVVSNSAVNSGSTVPISWDWQQGTPLAQAIVNALTNAFSGYTVVGAGTVKTITNLHGNDETGTYTLQDFVTLISTYSTTGQPAGYNGYQIQTFGNTFYLYDNSAPTSPKAVEFQDIIGQPTWINAAQLTFASVLRGDITLQDNISLPAGLYPPYVLTTAQAAQPNAAPSSRLTFNGTFGLAEVHHYANFRQADADSWRTQYVAFPNG